MVDRWSNVCHEVAFKDREVHRHHDELLDTHRLRQHIVPRLVIHQYATTDYNQYNECGSAGYPGLQGHLICHTGRPIFLDLHKPGIIICGAHLPIRKTFSSDDYWEESDL